VSLTPAANLLPVVDTSGKFATCVANDPNAIFSGLGKHDSGKTEAKIS
jgi:hypothetical protein